MALGQNRHAMDRDVARDALGFFWLLIFFGVCAGAGAAMDGDGFDDNAWASQHDGLGGLDLNSQAPVADEFPGLQQYGDFIQGDGVELPPLRGRGTGHLPYRPSRAGAGDTRANSAAPYALQLNFGASSSAAAGHGGRNGGFFPGGSSTGAGGAVRHRANSAAAAAGRRPQRANTAPRAPTSGGQRVPSILRPRAPRAPSTRGGRGQASGFGVPFDNDDEAMEDDVEELGSSGVPLVSHASRAKWNDSNNACLLELFIEQRRAGTYNGLQMSGEGYQAVVDGLLARRRLVYSRGQVKNQIGVLRNIHSFWRFLQTHTGLGRRPDGSIDADHEFWATHTEVCLVTLCCTCLAKLLLKLSRTRSSLVLLLLFLYCITPNRGLLNLLFLCSHILTEKTILKEVADESSSKRGLA